MLLAALTKLGRLANAAAVSNTRPAMTTRLELHHPVLRINNAPTTTATPTATAKTATGTNTATGTSGQ